MDMAHLSVREDAGAAIIQSSPAGRPPFAADPNADAAGMAEDGQTGPERRNLKALVTHFLGELSPA